MLSVDRSLLQLGCVVQRVVIPVALQAELYVASCSAPAAQFSRQHNPVEARILLAYSGSSYTPPYWNVPLGSHAWTIQRAVKTAARPSRNATSLDPAQITSLIKQSGSSQEVLSVLKQHGKRFNHIHVAATLTHAARLAANAQKALQGSLNPKLKPAVPRGPPELSQRQLQQLMVQLSGPFIRNLGSYSSREISNCLWSFAKLQLQPPPELLPAIAEVSSCSISPHVIADKQLLQLQTWTSW
jgi:hypothetical protein